MCFKKTGQETPFKGDNVKASVKTSNCENLFLYFSEKVQKIAAYTMFFLVFSDQTIILKLFLASPNDQKYPGYPLVLKSTAAAFGNSVFFNGNLVR